RHRAEWLALIGSAAESRPKGLGFGGSALTLDALPRNAKRGPIVNLPVAVLVLALGQASTEVSKGSRTLFEELAKIELVNGRFRVALKNASPNVSALRQRALALFPSASRIRVQSQNGSTSTSRGGTGGEVWIRIGHDGGPSSLHYQLTAPRTGSAWRQPALAPLPSASRIRVQSQNGSTSTSRGGTGGEVWIRIGHDGGPSSLHYQVTSPPTGETIVITQQANGDLKLQIDRRGLALSVEQTGA